MSTKWVVRVKRAQHLTRLLKYTLESSKTKERWSPLAFLFHLTRTSDHRPHSHDTRNKIKLLSSSRISQHLRLLTLSPPLHVRDTGQRLHHQQPVGDVMHCALLVRFSCHYTIHNMCVGWATSYVLHVWVSALVFAVFFFRSIYFSCLPHFYACGKSLVVAHWFKLSRCLSVRPRNRTPATNSHVSYFHFAGWHNLTLFRPGNCVSPMERARCGCMRCTTALELVVVAAVLLMQEGIRPAVTTNRRIKHVYSSCSSGMEWQTKLSKSVIATHSWSWSYMLYVYIFIWTI